MDIYEGRPGSGKSYDVAVNIIPFWLSMGSIIHTNIRVFHDAIIANVYERYGVRVEKDSLVYWEKGGDLWKNFRTACPRGTRQVPNMIFLDEAHKYINARDYAQVDKGKRENFMFCTEHRHFHIDIGLITQDSLNVDVQFRRLVQFYYRYRDLVKVKIPLIGKIYPMPHTMKFTIDYDGKTKMAQEIIVRRSAGFLLYDSHAAQTEETSWAVVSKQGKVSRDNKKVVTIVVWKVILVIDMLLALGVLFALIFI